MIINYIKTAWRNLVGHKFFSTLNVLGLALGVACSVLLLLWVQNELKMDVWRPATVFVCRTDASDLLALGNATA